MSYIKLRENCILNPETIHGVRILEEQGRKQICVLSFGRDIIVEDKYIPNIQNVIGSALILPVNQNPVQQSIPFKEKRTRYRGPIKIIKYKDANGNEFKNPRETVLKHLNQAGSYVGINARRLSDFARTEEHFVTKNGMFSIIRLKK